MGTAKLLCPEPDQRARPRPPRFMSAQHRLLAGVRWVETALVVRDIEEQLVGHGIEGPAERAYSVDLGVDVCIRVVMCWRPVSLYRRDPLARHPLT